MLDELRKDVNKSADRKRAKVNAWFFKTGKGEYGEGDQFVGLSVPKCREIAKKFKDLKFTEIKELLKSPIHEERLISLFILVNRFSKGDEKTKKEIFDFYLVNTKLINNWDLVDSSAYQIVGEFLIQRPRNVLFSLAKFGSIWERRIAIISTLAFIKKSELGVTFKIAQILLQDKHDLIQKAVGWMLREAGKKSQEDLVQFLSKNYKKMPRTMLRYAIERFQENLRKKYLNGLI